MSGPPRSTSSPLLRSSDSGPHPINLPLPLLFPPSSSRFLKKSPLGHSYPLLITNIIHRTITLVSRLHPYLPFLARLEWIKNEIFGGRKGEKTYGGGFLVLMSKRERRKGGKREKDKREKKKKQNNNSNNNNNNNESDDDDSSDMEKDNSSIRYALGLFILKGEEDIDEWQWEGWGKEANIIREEREKQIQKIEDSSSSSSSSSSSFSSSSTSLLSPLESLISRSSSKISLPLHYSFIGLKSPQCPSDGILPMGEYAKDQVIDLQCRWGYEAIVPKRKNVEMRRENIRRKMNEEKKKKSKGGGEEKKIRDDRNDNDDPDVEEEDDEISSMNPYEWDCLCGDIDGLLYSHMQMIFHRTEKGDDGKYYTIVIKYYDKDIHYAHNDEWKERVKKQLEEEKEKQKVYDHQRELEKAVEREKEKKREIDKMNKMKKMSEEIQREEERRRAEREKRKDKDITPLHHLSPPTSPSSSFSLPYPSTPFIPPTIIVPSKSKSNPHELKRRKRPPSPSTPSSHSSVPPLLRNTRMNHQNQKANYHDNTFIPPSFSSDGNHIDTSKNKSSPSTSFSSHSPTLLSFPSHTHSIHSSQNENDHLDGEEDLHNDPNDIDHQNEEIHRNIALAIAKAGFVKGDEELLAVEEDEGENRYDTNDSDKRNTTTQQKENGKGKGNGKGTAKAKAKGKGKRRKRKPHNVKNKNSNRKSYPAEQENEAEQNDNGGDKDKDADETTERKKRSTKRQNMREEKELDEMMADGHDDGIGEIDFPLPTESEKFDNNENNKKNSNDNRKEKKIGKFIIHQSDHENEKAMNDKNKNIKMSVMKTHRLDDDEKQKERGVEVIIIDESDENDEERGGNKPNKSTNSPGMKEMCHDNGDGEHDADGCYNSKDDDEEFLLPPNPIKSKGEEEESLKGRKRLQKIKTSAPKKNTRERERKKEKEKEKVKERKRSKKNNPREEEKKEEENRNQNTMENGPMNEEIPMVSEKFLEKRKRVHIECEEEEDNEKEKDGGEEEKKKEEDADGDGEVEREERKAMGEENRGHQDGKDKDQEGKGEGEARREWRKDKGFRKIKSKSKKPKVPKRTTKRRGSDASSSESSFPSPSSSSDFESEGDGEEDESQDHDVPTDDERSDGDDEDKLLTFQRQKERQKSYSRGQNPRNQQRQKGKRENPPILPLLNPNGILSPPLLSLPLRKRSAKEKLKRDLFVLRNLTLSEHQREEKEEMGQGEHEGGEGGEGQGEGDSVLENRNNWGEMESIDDDEEDDGRLAYTKGRKEREEKAKEKAREMIGIPNENFPQNGSKENENVNIPESDTYEEAEEEEEEKEKAKRNFNGREDTDGNNNNNNRTKERQRGENAMEMYVEVEMVKETKGGHNDNPNANAKAGAIALEVLKSEMKAVSRDGDEDERGGGEGEGDGRNQQPKDGEDEEAHQNFLEKSHPPTVANPNSNENDVDFDLSLSFHEVFSSQQIGANILINMKDKNEIPKNNKNNNNSTRTETEGEDAEDHRHLLPPPCCHSHHSILMSCKECESVHIDREPLSPQLVSDPLAFHNAGSVIFDDNEALPEIFNSQSQGEMDPNAYDKFRRQVKSISLREQIERETEREEMKQDTEYRPPKRKGKGKGKGKEKKKKNSMQDDDDNGEYHDGDKNEEDADDSEDDVSDDNEEELEEDEDIDDGEDDGAESYQESDSDEDSDQTADSATDDDNSSMNWSGPMKNSKKQKRQPKGKGKFSISASVSLGQHGKAKGKEISNKTKVNGRDEDKKRQEKPLEKHRAKRRENIGEASFTTESIIERAKLMAQKKNVKDDEGNGHSNKIIGGSGSHGKRRDVENDEGNRNEKGNGHGKEKGNQRRNDNALPPHHILESQSESEENDENDDGSDMNSTNHNEETEKDNRVNDGEEREEETEKEKQKEIRNSNSNHNGITASFPSTPPPATLCKIPPLSSWKVKKSLWENNSKETEISNNSIHNSHRNCSPINLNEGGRVSVNASQSNCRKENDGKQRNNDSSHAHSASASSSSSPSSSWSSSSFSRPRSPIPSIESARNILPMSIIGKGVSKIIDDNHSHSQSEANHHENNNIIKHNNNKVNDNEKAFSEAPSSHHSDSEHSRYHPHLDPHSHSSSSFSSHSPLNILTPQLPTQFGENSNIPQSQMLTHFHNHSHPLSPSHSRSHDQMDIDDGNLHHTNYHNAHDHHDEQKRTIVSNIYSHSPCSYPSPTSTFSIPNERKNRDDSDISIEEKIINIPQNEGKDKDVSSLFLHPIDMNSNFTPPCLPPAPPLSSPNLQYHHGIDIDLLQPSQPPKRFGNTIHQNNNDDHHHAINPRTHFSSPPSPSYSSQTPLLSIIRQKKTLSNPSSASSWSSPSPYSTFPVPSPSSSPSLLINDGMIDDFPQEFSKPISTNPTLLGRGKGRPIAFSSPSTSSSYSSRVVQSPWSTVILNENNLGSKQKPQNKTIGRGGNSPIPSFNSNKNKNKINTIKNIHMPTLPPSTFSSSFHMITQQRQGGAMQMQMSLGEDIED